MSLSNYAENAVLNALFRNVSLAGGATVYVSLHTGDPGEDGTSNEVSGTNYARKAVTASTGFNAASGGSMTNNGAITFAAAGSGGWGTVTYAGIFDAISGGNFLIGGALDAGTAINENDVYEIPDQDLTLTMD